MKFTSLLILILNIAVCFSQNGFVGKRFSFKNPKNVNTCIIANALKGDTLIIQLHVSTNIADTFHEYHLVMDTFYVLYGNQNKVLSMDSVFSTDSLGRRKLDYYTTKVEGFSQYPKKHGYIFTYIYFQRQPPVFIKFNHDILCGCPIFPFSYDIYKNDTINLVNSNGWKDGLWLKFYDSGELMERKNYKNGRLLSGTTFDRNGNDLHIVTEDEGGIISVIRN